MNALLTRKVNVVAEEFHSLQQLWCCFFPNGCEVVLKVTLNVSAFHGENITYIRAESKWKNTNIRPPLQKKKNKYSLHHQLVSCTDRFYSHRFNVFVAISKLKSWDIISREVSVEKNIDLLLIFVLRKKLHENFETFRQFVLTCFPLKHARITYTISTSQRSSSPGLS